MMKTFRKSTTTTARDDNWGGGRMKRRPNIKSKFITEEHVVSKDYLHHVWMTNCCFYKKVNCVLNLKQNNISEIIAPRIDTPSQPINYLTANLIIALETIGLALAFYLVFVFAHLPNDASASLAPLPANIPELSFASLPKPLFCRTTSVCHNFSPRLAFSGCEIQLSFGARGMVSCSPLLHCFGFYLIRWRWGCFSVHKLAKGKHFASEKALNCFYFVNLWLSKNFKAWRLRKLRSPGSAIIA